MAGYIIAEVSIEDLEGFERYRQMVPPTIEQYGGRYVVRGGRCETLEGDWSPSRLVMIEFPTFEQAKAWWSSEEYAEAKALRQATARSKLLLIEGV